MTTVTATSFDEVCRVIIPKDTIGLTVDLEPLTQVNIVEVHNPPAPPSGSHIIGLAYDISPDGVSFDPAATLIWKYNPADLAAWGVTPYQLTIAYYDESRHQWITLDSTVSVGSQTFSAPLAHLTTFAIISEPEPAAFSVSSLNITPKEVTPGEAVSISIMVTNSGGSEGNYSAALKINGVLEATKSLSVAAGESKPLTFTVTKADRGVYTVLLEGFSGTFKVAGLVTPPPTTETPGVEEPTPAPTEPAPTEPAPTEPAPTQTPAATTPAATTPAVEETPVNWGVLGGLIGGAVVIIGLLVTLMWIRRRGQ